MEVAAFDTGLIDVPCDIIVFAVAGCWDCIVDEVGDVTGFCATAAGAVICVGDGAVAVISFCVVVKTDVAALST